ncbi:hypothetical protein HJFPF1_12817 [Paramyrothecium foliicola]|nr:hypothetical protein HJFPF1_12817 [Paramyrothecium foliicola]
MLEADMDNGALVHPEKHDAGALFPSIRPATAPYGAMLLAEPLRTLRQDASNDLVALAPHQGMFLVASDLEHRDLMPAQSGIIEAAARALGVQLRDPASSQIDVKVVQLLPGFAFGVDGGSLGIALLLRNGTGVRMSCESYTTSMNRFESDAFEWNQDTFLFLRNVVLRSNWRIRVLMLNVPIA